MSDEPNWFPHENDGSTEEGDRGGEDDEDDDYDRFSPRYLHRATQCGKDLTKVILFGGQSTSGFHNDVFFLDMNERKNPTHAFEKLHVSGEPPLPRCSGSIQTLRVFGNKPGLGREVIALFGGSQGYITGFQDDLLVLAPSDKKSNEDISMALERKSSLTWYEPTIIEKNPVHGRPAPRWGHATFARNGKLLVFGGSNTNAVSTISGSARWRARTTRVRSQSRRRGSYFVQKTVELTNRYHVQGLGRLCASSMTSRTYSGGCQRLDYV